MEKQVKVYYAYADCAYCDGTGGYSSYCCSGMEDGVQSCGCAGQGVWNECPHCEDGKVVVDEIIWNWDDLIEVDIHDHQKYYAIYGTGKTNKRDYVATVIYTNGEFDELTEIEEY
jgi:hypothetical protein